LPPARGRGLLRHADPDPDAHAGRAAMSVAGALDVRGVSVKADGRPILSGIDVSLRPGELCALVGPSGSGKSTFMKVLLGLRAPASGTVSIGGRSVGDAGPIGYVPQDDALHTALTVAESLGFAAELRLPDLPALARAARVEEVIRQVGLEERLDVRIKRLSGGQRKRVSVAMELLTRPPVLILDEPTSGLDPGLEARLMELFAQIAHQGRIVLVATHAMESLPSCDALLVLVGGCIAWFGAPAAAPSHFGTAGYAGIFGQLPSRTPGEWAAAWAQSPQRTTFANRPQVRAGSSSAPTATDPAPGLAVAAAPRPTAPIAPIAPIAPASPLPSPAARRGPLSDSDLQAQLAAVKARLRKDP
jgi:ABC-type multidrug transport system ATPase subunit